MEVPMVYLAIGVGVTGLLVRAGGWLPRRWWRDWGLMGCCVVCVVLWLPLLVLIGALAMQERRGMEDAGGGDEG